MAVLLVDTSKVPRHGYSFLWADYVELMCLCSRNQMISKGNIDAQTQEAGDVQSDSVEFGEEGEETEEMDDRVSRRWSDIHSRLTARSKQYADWPFQLERNVLRSRFDKENPRHRLYAALLIASSLRLCIDNRRHEVTGAFEEISFHWLRKALNDLWEVRPFGAHQNLPGAYVGTLFEKFKQLAADIQATQVKSREHYDARNTADGGIDLVAWLKIGDRRGNIPVIFGQCACSPTDWESKQLDVTPAAIRVHVLPQHDGAAYCFVPHDLSANDSVWDRAEHVKGVVLVDRLRLFRLFESCGAVQHLPTWQFVDDAAQSNVALAS
ncbi:restriction endonuclease [Comamonas aquatica]|uniref:Restriction endonuclease n=1 Tax=Comamonas aquatica TaxID=225991 RepID=A0AA42W4Z3_9BURK|nr:hypothetical protein [Comamonas aquatica]MDH1427397.1 restriction endonuclease [Comamonas aquatica]MDH1607692.1 restriction endonuclease [Comamonas aquatica]MDH2007430.1 restriction endonuclease [Comamonas aquatica]